MAFCAFLPLCLQSCSNSRQTAQEISAQNQAAKSGKYSVETTEGLVQQVQVTVGPFDIHRKYRSMEGPYCAETFRVSDLLATKDVHVNESEVKFVENGNRPSMTAATEAGAPNTKVVHSTEPKQLVWAKGVKLIVLDEHDKPLPTGEFICHFNIDVDPRNTVFPNVHAGSPRLFTLTQGQTDFHFPEGFGVPLSSNEFLHITFQAANRTTSEHRRIKHLCTLDLVKDSDLKQPLKPLSWYTPYVAVQVNKDTAPADTGDHGPSCMVMSHGENAPNAVAGAIVTDSKERKMTGHWKVPAGLHPYTSPVSEERDYGFNNEDRIVHAVWTHVHPLCKKVTLVVCDGEKKTPAWSVDVSTKTDHGLELSKIGNLYFKDGVLLPKGKHFEIDSVYDNVTGVVQDSMVSQGIFFEDRNFVKPNWENEPAVAANTSGSTSEDYNGTDRYSPFSNDTDGPMLTAPKTLELATSVGKLHLVLDPTIAPKHATQLYKLFKAGAFDDTSVITYMPNYIFQVGSIDIKHGTDKPTTADQLAMLRRLPLEIEAHKFNRGLHGKWALTMARSHAEDSAVSSFSILLNDAPHLNNRYAVFGHLIPDATTVATMKKMVSTWDREHPYFISAKEVGGKKPGDKGTSAVLASTLDSIAGGSSTKEACTDLYCGIKPTFATADKNAGDKNKVTATKQPAPEDKYPLFNAKTDGPLLTAAKPVEMHTSAGVIRMVIDPTCAPMNASQMYKLFKAGAFDGTSIVRYEPNFVLQTALAQVKENPNKHLAANVESMLRRLPLEVSAQKKGTVLHKKWALSMAHGDDPNSAVTSFSIVLGNAPHLDTKFTIFGHVVEDAETVKTLEKIQSEWTRKQPYIVSVRDEHQSIAAK